MKIAYLGPKGTFSEEAAMRYFAGQNIEPVMYKAIPDVLDAVEEHAVDQGIVPIENAIEGTITMTTDGLINDDVWIVGEAILPVSLHLLTVPGSTALNVKEVWSIPPALAQCRKYIKELKAESVHFNSTASAAETLKKEGRTDAGAIASEWAAKTFGLDIAKRDIHDFAGNSTRFVVISKEKPKCMDATKSMLLITPGEDRPGLLAIILNVFSSLNINLTWIESRPTKKKLGTYRFFIEAELSLEEPNLKKAITILETYGHDVRILGSYKSKKL